MNQHAPSRGKIEASQSHAGLGLKPLQRRVETLPAVHEQDLAKIMGTNSIGTWNCHECGREGTGMAAGYVKQDAALLPICFTCFVLGNGLRRER